ncbi:MAG: heavy-metal-associated domain-containing protein [Clostridiales bacterium]|jgi:copper chaperone CopZ|nr:heavy-metal-associated domain-containing protein [Clostridiales bacterium]
MKKSYEAELDCANCARKVQEAILKDPRVKFCSVNYMSQKITLEADDADFDDVVKMAADCVRKVDPDCEMII